jgi:hypothetical protein
MTPAPGSHGPADTRHIICPNCGAEIDVNEILYHQLDEELRRKYQEELARERRGFEDREADLGRRGADLERQRRALEARVSEGIHAGVKAERARLEAGIRKSMEEEHSERIDALNAEIERKTEQVKALNKARSEVERLKREMDEMRGAIELETQKKLTQTLSEERERIRKSEEQRATMQISERDQLIRQLKDQLQQAQRKAEQGSMQVQGEAQELVIEEWLAVQFPLDTIEGIKKGAQGADCLQIVNTRSRRNCGSIYYESKRTKHFQPSWIEKFKADIRRRNAGIGVLVTEAMPADMERMGLREGVWVCTFDEFKGLCFVLRESIIRISDAVVVAESKGDKMGMLYDYLTGSEFRHQVEAIVEGFTQMQADLESEKRAMQGIWKKREKQIEKVLLNTNYMYSSVRGIAGSAVRPLPQLELPADEE